MTEGRTTKRRRARRPSEAAARLERLRKRNADQLETQREAERRIETALQSYVDADVAISGIEQDRDDKVANLEQQIEQARTAAQVQIEQIRAQQAMVVWQISDAGRTAQQIAELLELPQKEARQLLRAGRATANSDAAAVTDRTNRSRDNIALADRQQQPSEQRELSGVDGHQDGADTGLVPSIANSGGQRT
jgi:hypothetical protein